jgi:hypothetical protein
MADDWWARNLGTPSRAPAQQPQRYQQPPQQQAPQYQQQAPQYQQAQQQVDPNRPLIEQAMSWRGGEAHRTETVPCPKCGGGHFYSRSQGISRGPAPAPMCFDCGFNGMFEQGDPATWQTAAG